MLITIVCCFQQLSSDFNADNLVDFRRHIAVLIAYIMQDTEMWKFITAYCSVNGGNC